MSPNTTSTLMWVLVVFLSSQLLTASGPTTPARVSSASPVNWASGSRYSASAPGSSTSEKKERYGNTMPNAKVKTKRSQSPSGGAKKLAILEQIAQALQIENLATDQLYTIVEILTRLDTSEEPISEHEKTTVSTILRALCKLAGKITSNDGYFPYYLASGAVILVSRGITNEININYIQDMSIYEDRIDNFSIYLVETFSENKDRNFELVIHQKNVSPFRPLPVTKTPIVWFHVVDYFLGDKPVTDFHALAGVAMRWMYETPLPNVRYGCQRWNDTDTAWSSQGCVLIDVCGDWSTSQIVCHCDVVFNGNYSEYILYRYDNEIQATINIDDFPMQDDIFLSSGYNYTEIQRVLNDILGNQHGSEYFTENLNLYLRNLTLLCDNNIANDTTDAILRDIGVILMALEPDEGLHTIGYRNKLLGTFVVQTEPAPEGELPIGFGVYENYLLGFECFMATEEIDVNSLFSSQMNFSLLFSKSVAQQNSRYAFLVYPPGKFFKPTAYINGQQVMNIRVVDLVLTPSQRDVTEDQYVHLYNGLITNTNLYDCAFWSLALANWSTDGCRPNPGLYKGVCTCIMRNTFNMSMTRVQYVIFNYSPSKIFYPAPEINKIYRTSTEDTMNLIKILHVDMYQYYPKSDGTLVLMMQDLSRILVKFFILNLYYRLVNRERNELTSSVRRALITSEDCKTYDDQLVALCSNNCMKSVHTTAFYINNSHVQVVDDAENKMFNSLFADKEFALQVSESVVSLNGRHAFLVYYKNSYFWDAPIGQRVNSRVVDVILSPRDAAVEEQQFVEFTFQRPDNHALGCGVWDNVSNDWTTLGCQIVRIADVDACNCSLSGNGGQYIVYSYIDRVFDQIVFEQFSSENFTDSARIFEQGAALIHNASLQMFDKPLVTAVVQVFVKMVQHMQDLEDGQQKIAPVVSDMKTAFEIFVTYYNDVFPLIHHFPGEWSEKWIAFADDLFSSTDNSTKNSKCDAKDSAMVFGVVLFDIRSSSVLEYTYNGVLLSRDDHTEAQLTNSLLVPDILKDNPSLVCLRLDHFNLELVRTAFLVYPMNVSPFKYSMTSDAIFNSRQVDVYYKANQEGNRNVVVYFQPSDEPEDYISTACAVWNDTLQDWSGHLCSVIFYTKYESCICELSASTSVTRIIIYQYTQLPNFSLSYSLGGTSVVYLIGSTLSLLGQFMIAMTAILSPDWREEGRTKIFLQLTLSHFLYLVMTMIRESHIIYADLKQLDVGLVVFTFFLHYTRLVHHCWGLVMSVLQYKRFTGLVGELSTKNLLVKVCVFAWCAPLVPLAVLLSWDVKTHFSTPDNLTHYLLYLIPDVVIVLLNLGLLVAIVRIIANCCGTLKGDDLQHHGATKLDVHLLYLKSQMLMCFLFGIPAGIEMLNNFACQRIAVIFITKVLDSSQSFVLFMLFVLKDDKTRRFWNINVFGDLPSVPVIENPLRKDIKLNPLKKKVMTPTQTKPVVGLACVECVKDGTPEFELSRKPGSEDCIKVQNEMQPSTATAQLCEHGSLQLEMENTSAAGDTCVLEVSKGPWNGFADVQLALFTDLFDGEDICTLFLAQVYSKLLQQEKEVTS